MKIGSYTFDRMEFAGSLGDLGTIIPLSIALIMICQLSFTTVFLLVGLFYIFCGSYFKLPIPVQPLKVFTAIAIANPDKVTITILASSGLILGIFLIILAISGWINWIARFFQKPIVRGIQLGLGLILITKGIDYILKQELLIEQSENVTLLYGIHLNPIIGICGSFLALLLISNKHFPAALVIVISGLFIGIFSGSLDNVILSLGPLPIKTYLPVIDELPTVIFLLVIPQVPLTLGNAVVGTSDTCFTLFGKNESTNRISIRALCTSMGLANVVAGILGGMPMCHGSGGLAAHYRFGARTGGSNIIIGLVFLFLAIAFGTIGIAVLSAIPNAVLGILLLFAGLELAVLIRDIEEKNDLFVSLIIAGIGFATTNMSIALLVGIMAMFLIRWKKLSL